MRYRFDNCEFDSDAFELRLDAVPVGATPKVLDLLHLLLENRFRLIEKDELVEHIWDGRAISDSAITVLVKALRNAIGDSGTKQRLVKTIRGKGLRFVGEVSAESQRNIVVASDKESVESRARDDGRMQPSIAVLPFELTSSTGQHAMFAEALPDEIITALSRLKWISVLARGTCFLFPSYTVSPIDIGEKLGVGYCVSGSLDVESERLRLSLELADARRGDIIWRDFFKINLRGVHELQVELVHKITLAIEENVKQRELNHARLAAPDNLDSWKAHHLGMGKLNTRPIPDYGSAIDFFRQSTSYDPNFARAMAGLSQGLISQIQWSEHLVTDKMWEETERMANMAMDLDPFDPFCNLAKARTALRHYDLDAFQLYVDKSIELCPSNALAYSDRARIQAATGKYKEARESMAIVELLDPLSPHPETIETTHILIDLGEGKIEAAANRAIQLTSIPGLAITTSLTILIAMHIAGKTEEAKRVADSFKKRFSKERTRHIFTSTSKYSPAFGAISGTIGKSYSLI